MIIEKRLRFGSAVIMMKPVEEDRVAIIDGQCAVRFFSLAPVELLGGFKTSIKYNLKLYNGCDISSDGGLVAFCVPQEGVVVFSAAKKRLLFNFKRHEGDVECLKVSDRHGYLATGGQDGKTFLWSLATGRMVASLPHHADFVTAVAFSPNGQWIATGGFDRKVLLSNLSSLSQSFRLRGHGGAITDLKFLKGHRLAVADRSGEIVIWDYYETKIVRRLKKMLGEVVSLATTPDDRFLFAADSSGIVSLYDLDSYEMLSLRYLSYSKPIRKILYLRKGNYLVVGLETGEVTFNSPLKESEQIDALIEEGRYGDAYVLAESNPILRYSDAFIRLEAIWEEHFEEAVKLLEEGRFEEAKKVLEPFNTDGTKRLLMQQLVHDYKEFDKFRKVIEKKHYQIAYALASQYPLLKENPLYQKMEQEWEKLFARAKKIILQNGGEDKVRELLKPFRGIPSKSALIQKLLADREVYKLFMKMVAKRDYKNAIELARRYPAIQELEEYHKIERIAEAIAQKAEHELEEGNYAEVVRLATELMEFPDKREEAQALKKKADLYASAMRNFAEKNYAAVYRMLEEYPYLEETRIVSNLEEVWRKLVKKAEIAAAKGDVATIKRILAPFMKIPQKRFNIVALIKQAYLEQIEAAAKRSAERMKGGILRYLELFGYDDEIATWMMQKGATEGYPKPEEVDPITIAPDGLPEQIV